MMKRTLSLFLAAMMVCSLLVGCGAKETAEQPSATEEPVSEEAAVNNETADEYADVRISDEVIQLTLAGGYGLAHAGDWNNTVQFQEYEKRLGIKLDATTYDSETWKSQKTLLIAGDEMPDIMANANLTAAEVAEFGADEFLLDFGQYLDVMPNLQAIFEEYPEYKAYITDSEGHIYGFPRLNARSDFQLAQECIVNTTWLENVGKEIPRSLDELYDVLVAFKEQDANGNGDPNDEIPFVYQHYLKGVLHSILNAFGIPSQSRGTTILHTMVNDDNEVVFGETTENYKEYLRFMNKLYDEGLINQDAYILSNEEVRAIVQDGRAGFSAVGADCYAPTDDPASTWAFVPPFTSEYNDKSTVVLSTRVSELYTIVANSDTEYPEEIAKFVDYLFSDEGALSTANGYEGISFDFVEVNGFGVADHSNYWEAEGYESANYYRQAKAVALEALDVYRANKGTIYDMLNNSSYEELLSGPVYENTPYNALRASALEMDNVEVVNIYPLLVYPDAVADERATIKTDLTTYMANAEAEFITGVRDVDKDWDAHIATLKQMKIDRLTEIEQEAYDAYLASVK